VGGGRFSVRRVIVALAIVGAAAFGAAQAFGASEPITTKPECCAYGKPTFTIDRGAVATFQNEDPGVSQHDVTAFDTGGAKNLPLFRSAQINLGQTPVNGTDAVGPGTYRFFCTVHPTEMTGQLVVTPSASPTVAVKVLSRKVGQVGKSGKVKVKLTGLLASRGVSVTARIGKRKLGTAKGIDLSASASRTVTVPLSRSGKNFLSHRGSAKLKVTASPPGDQTVTATQRLR
jgi:plastocyanin